LAIGNRISQSLEVLIDRVLGLRTIAGGGGVLRIGLTKAVRTEPAEAKSPF
jgi:hypothetical protein